MTHGSLFSGIGGFDLAAEWVGFSNKWQIEIDLWCQRVLAKNFPEVKRYGDIRTVGKKNLERVDIISGGFPCQPFSVAGKQRGKEDDRFLWPEMLRVIREMRPSFIVGENVTGIIGLALDQVLADLENEGYTCEPFIVPACAVNAPHRRDRVWIIAHSCNFNDGWGYEHKRKENHHQKKRRDLLGKINRPGSIGITSHTNSERRKERDTSGESEGPGFCSRNVIAGWDNWPTQSGICRGNARIPHRVDRIKGLGNAIVPQVALQIFKAIKEIAE
jgi:DNA (cytosine-5)-methyltransferase 1